VRQARLPHPCFGAAPRRTRLPGPLRVMLEQAVEQPGEDHVLGGGERREQLVRPLTSASA
jgi:hypothetical protein